MKQEMVDRIKNDPDFLQLTRERTKFAWTLTIVMLVIYFGFVLVIAFDPKLLGTSLCRFCDNSWYSGRYRCYS
jgi:uncharacterized membrane protein (DUF485 family)